MKIGDVVVSTSETGLEQIPMIYMGIGLWKGWVRVYCPKAQRVIQVRKTFIEKVAI